MNVLQLILEIVGAVSTIATSIGLLLPRGNRAGYIAAKIGADLKNHTKKLQG